MTRRWVVLGTGLGLTLGVIVGATSNAGEVLEPAPPPAPASAPVVRAGPTTVDTKFVEISPVRAFDSRKAAYAASGSFAPNQSKVVNIKDGHDDAGTVTTPNAVPEGATAVAYNLTVAAPTGPNYLAITPGDATGFTVSAINFNGSADVANAGIVAIDGLRNVKVWNGDQSGSTHVIIDITGYYVKPLFAEVASNGTLINGSRVTSSASAPPGIYTVTFDRDVSRCAKNVTIGKEGIAPEQSGLIDVVGTGNVVRVYSTNSDGKTLSDRAFYLAVTC